MAAHVAKRRCAFISNIPPSLSSTELEAFLLKELESSNHDGSHLVKVIFPVNPSTPGLALATFTDEKAMVTLMRKRLVYEREHFTMQPFLSYVFSSVSAVVNPDVSNLFPFISPNFSRLMEKECGVECHQLDEKERDRWMHISQIRTSEELYMLTGNWYQLQNARKFMQEWVVDERKSQFTDHNCNIGDETKQKGASSSNYVNPHKDLSQRENYQQERISDKKQFKGLSGNFDDSGLDPEIPSYKPNGDSRNVVITDSTRVLERSSLNSDSRKGKKDQRKSKRDGKPAKVACAFDEESNSQKSSKTSLERGISPVDAVDVAVSHPSQSVSNLSPLGHARKKDPTTSQEIVHHEDPAQSFNPSSQNFKHYRNHLAEGMSSHLPDRGVTPGAKTNDGSSVQDQRREDDTSEREAIHSCSSSAVAPSPRSLENKEDEFGGDPSVDYMKQVKVPQTPLSSFSPQLNRSKEVKDNSQRIGDAASTKNNEDEEKMSQRDDVEEDCAGPLPANSSIDNERSVDDEENEERRKSLGSIPVDPGVFSYILLKQSDSIRDIEEKYGVKFSILTTSNGDDTDIESAMLKVKSLRETADISKAHDKFVDLYTVVFGSLHHRVVTVVDATIDLESLNTTVDAIHESYASVLLTISSDKVLVYGPSESDVRLAKSWIVDAMKKQKGSTKTDISEVSGQNAEHSIHRGVNDVHLTKQETLPRQHYRTEVNGHDDTEYSLTRGSMSPIHQEPTVRPQRNNDTDEQTVLSFTRERVDVAPGEQVAVSIPVIQTGGYIKQMDSSIRVKHDRSSEPDIGAIPQPHMINGYDVHVKHNLFRFDRPSGQSEDGILEHETPGDPKRSCTSPVHVGAGPEVLSQSPEVVKSKVRKSAEEVTELDGGSQSEDAVSMTNMIPVDPGVFGYIQAKKHTSLSNIEQNHKIKFIIKGNVDSDIYLLNVEPVGAVTDETIQNGKESFLRFYSEVFSGLEHRAISLGDFKSLSEDDLDKALQGIEHSFTDVLFRVVGSRILIYGNGLHNVETARDFVLNRLRQNQNPLVDLTSHVDLNASMDSLSSEGMMSRLNHLRFGSLSPEALSNEIMLTQTQSGNVGLCTLPEDARHETPKHLSSSPTDHIALNKGNAFAISMEEAKGVSDVTTPSTSHSGRLREERGSMKNEGNVYKFSDNRLIVELASSGICVQVYRADITRVAVNAIVSAANERLFNIGGIAGGICRAAGRRVQADCNMYIARKGLLYPSEVMYTDAGNLPCKFILHAVGPRWEDYTSEEECRRTLRSTVVNCLKCAEQELQLTSVAMPLISSGIFGVPLEICLEEICEALRDYSQNGQSIKILQQVHIVDLDNATVQMAQDMMLYTLCEKEKGVRNSLAPDEMEGSHYFDNSSNLDSVARGQGAAGDLQHQEDYLLEEDTEIVRRSRKEHKQRRSLVRSSKSSRRQYDSSDEDIPDQKFKVSRPVMARSASLPYLTGNGVDNQRTSCWLSGTADMMTTETKGIDQRSIRKSRTASKVSSQSTRQDNRINDILEAHSRAPPSPELSRKTQYEINCLLTEPEVAKREKQRRKIRRSQSLDRAAPPGKCFVCSSVRNLSKRKSCEHFVCETCKLCRLDVGSCEECTKLKHKKVKICDLCGCSEDFMLVKCKSCDKSICILCLKKGLDMCQGCLYLLSNGHGEKKQPKLREPIVVGTRPTQLDMKKGYRIKTSSSDATSSRKKPMLGLSQSSDVACSNSSRSSRSSSDLKMPAKTRSAFSKEYVTEDAPHDEMMRHLSRDQEARDKVYVQEQELPRSGQSSGKQSSRAVRLKVTGKSSPLVSRQPQADCVICMERPKNPKELSKCRHTFCTKCIDMAFKVKPVCPICGEHYGTLRGNQPKGTMTDVSVSTDLPGHPGCGTIIINYSIPLGIQTEEHPNPGSRYRGTHRQTFLPNSREGAEVLKLLRRAFDARLLFTIGQSITTGEENVVVWNDIHQKTSQNGGASMHGYPDPGYLQRVRDELGAKGIK